MTTATATTKLSEVLTAAQLPALPQSAITLLQLSQDPNNGPAEFARPIEADPGLLGQVLKFVNSAYFGFSREIASVQQALTLVGVRAITNFALWSAVFSLVPNPKFGAFDLKGLWQDSLRRGLFARLLGRQLKLREAEDLFAGALLQDMAIPLLLKELPEQYAPLLARRESENARLSSLEKEFFGWDHAEAAGVLARKWNLPEEFAGLMENHTQLDQLLAGGESLRGRACVALASLLPSCNDPNWNEKDLFVAGYRQLVGSTDDLKSLLQDVDESAEKFAPLLKLPVPQVKLTNLV
ncbi:HDOD domain-containing protein [Rosistilla oblonga]|uniref:HDOD domain-containing protein n=1 Tax=Rosistilla oblonga TaxID=2527990 RepID=UPI003A97A908